MTRSPLFQQMIDIADGVRVMSDQMTVAEVQAELDAIESLAAAAGLRKPKASIEIGRNSFHRAWSGTLKSEGETGKYFFVNSLDEVFVGMRAYIAALPHQWSAIDVAATLGLPICEHCDEAVATTTLHDEMDAALWRVPNTQVCEPCLDRARDNAAEALMEQAS